MTIRVGVIGVGVMGADHARRLTRVISGATVCAVTDFAVDRAEALAAELGAQVFGHRLTSLGPVRDLFGIAPANGEDPAERRGRHEYPTSAVAGLCRTSAGDVTPARGPDHSPLPFRTASRQWPRRDTSGSDDPAGSGRARDSIGLSTLAEMLRDNGIRYLQRSGSPTVDQRSGARGVDRVRADLFEAAPILGVDHIEVGADDVGVPVGYAVLCEGFDRLADDAKSAGVRIAFENTPFTPTSRQPRTRWPS